MHTIIHEALVPLKVVPRRLVVLVGGVSTLSLGLSSQGFRYP